jgi:hypothetical protein
MDIGHDDALVGVTPRPLLNCSHTLLAKVFDGLIEIAVGLDESLLAFHHSDASTIP